jgi:hypothetical protein
MVEQLCVSLAPECIRSRCKPPLSDCSALFSGSRRWLSGPGVQDSYLVDSASSHMLVSKIKPCMSKYKQSIP